MHASLMVSIFLINLAYIWYNKNGAVDQITI